MTEPDPLPLPKPARLNSGLLWLALTILVAAALGASAYFLPQYRQIALGGDSEPLQGKMNGLERKMQALTTRMENLDTRVSDLASGTLAQNSASLQNAPNDIAHVQNDLANLATTVGGLQEEVKQARSTVHAEAQTMLAKMIAFMQLREAATSDHGFAKELAAMRTTAGDDAELKELLNKLGPNAENGVANMADLREKLAEQANATQVATEKAGAQYWWERVLAELRGLISIRPLHGPGTPNDTLAQMEMALTHDDVTTALDKMKTLPQSAQDILAEWRAQAEARQTISQTLHDIADRLVAGAQQTAQQPAKPPAQDAP